MQSSVVIFRVHQDFGVYRDALAKLRAELSSTFRVEVVSYLDRKVPAIGVFENSYMYDADEIKQLPYRVRLNGFDPADSRGYNELPIMQFFRVHSNYHFYWIVECDVHYTGCWGTLFEALATSRADLLGTAVADRSEDPDWCHWAGLRWDEAPLPPDVCVKSFMPFGRVSRAALAAIDAACASGLTGHPEAMWPTICKMRGLTIEDIGGGGSYAPERWKSKHYWNTLRDPYLAPGSFVFRPSFSKAEIDSANLPPMLWHPVKC